MALIQAQFSGNYHPPVSSSFCSIQAFILFCNDDKHYSKKKESTRDEEGDDDNDKEEIVGFLAMLQDLVFSQKIEKIPSMFMPHNIYHPKDPKPNHKIKEANATNIKKPSKHRKWMKNIGSFGWTSYVVGDGQLELVFFFNYFF